MENFFAPTLKTDFLTLHFNLNDLPWLSEPTQLVPVPRIAFHSPKIKLCTDGARPKSHHKINDYIN